MALGAIIPPTLGDPNILTCLAPATRLIRVVLRGIGLGFVEPNRPNVSSTQPVEQVTAHVGRRTATVCSAFDNSCAAAHVAA